MADYNQGAAAPLDLNLRMPREPVTISVISPRGRLRRFVYWAYLGRLERLAYGRVYEWVWDDPVEHEEEADELDRRMLGASVAGERGA